MKKFEKIRKHSKIWISAINAASLAKTRHINNDAWLYFMLKSSHSSLFMWEILAKDAALIAEIHLNLAALLCKGIV